MKWPIRLVLLAIALLCGSLWGSLQPAAAAERAVQDPEYAKWSRLAFHEAGRLYTLLDYKYLGRSDAAPGVAQQQFRFWARAKTGGSEFPLIVTIRYNPVTDKVYTITMEEEQRGGLMQAASLLYAAFDERCAQHARLA